jgi:hypothetical protein
VPTRKAGVRAVNGRVSDSGEYFMALIYRTIASPLSGTCITLTRKKVESRGGISMNIKRHRTNGNAYPYRAQATVYTSQS